MSWLGGVGGTSARNPPRCAWGLVYVHVCVCGHMHRNLSTCVCVCVCTSAQARVHTRAGDCMSVGCLCFNVCQSHFVLHD